jgi:hypothetical protein
VGLLFLWWFCARGCPACAAAAARGVPTLAPPVKERRPHRGPFVRESRAPRWRCDRVGGPIGGPATQDRGEGPAQSYTYALSLAERVSVAAPLREASAPHRRGGQPGRRVNRVQNRLGDLVSRTPGTSSPVTRINLNLYREAENSKAAPEKTCFRALRYQDEIEWLRNHIFSGRFSLYGLAVHFRSPH